MFDQQHNPAPLTRAPLQLIHSVNNDDDNDDDYLEQDGGGISGFM